MPWIIFTASLFNLALGAYVWSRNPKSYVNRSFGIFSIVTGFWVFNNFLLRFFPTLFFIRNAYALGALVPALAIIWILYICDGKVSSARQIGSVILGTLFFILSHINGLIVQEIVGLEAGGYKGTTGFLFPLYSAYMFGTLGFIVYKLYSTERRSVGIKKSQIRYVLFGAGALIAIVLIVSFILPLLGTLQFTSLDSPSSLIFIGFTTYAILRYRFMDIRRVVVRSIAFGFIILFITGVYAAFSALVGQFFETLVGVKSNILVGFIIAILVAIGYQPMKNLIERVTNKFLFKKAYDPDELLAEITDVTSSILDLDNLLKSITGSLAAAFHPSKIGIALLDKDKKLQVAYQEGFDGGIENFVRGKEKVLPLYFKDTREIYVIEELKTAYERGDYQPKNVKLLYALYELEIGLIVPLFTKEKLIGLIALGNKKAGDLYTKGDLTVLDIIAGQAAIGIENAQLYDELKGFSLKLQKEVEIATADLRKANIQLRELDEAKSEFISIASHQLRTPLTVIKGYISMMLEGDFGRIPAKIMENLKKIYKSNERLISLIEDLLDISRIESGRQEFNFQPIRLEQLAGEVVDEFQNKAKEKGLTLSFVKGKKMAKVVADAAKIREVITNFIDNAIKYTEKGIVAVSVRQVKDRVIFAVKDTGMGIPPEEMPHLFQKFSRAKGTFLIHTEGSGLGLYVAKILIDAHLGQIKAESEGRGKGSTFSFSLPVMGKGLKPGIVKRKQQVGK